MRAALLPTPGNPFLVEHWLRNYDQVWRSEVDELRVCVNGQTDPEVRAFIRSRVELRGGIYHEFGQFLSGHGEVLTILVDATEADTLMLVEDDCLVRRPDAVASRFRRIEAGEVDVIGSPRGSMTGGVHDRAAKLFPLNDTPRDGGAGFGMWPSFVFVRRDALLATDRNYASTGWAPGDYVPGLDFHVSGEECADTFGAMAFQLRRQFRVANDSQWKGPDTWREWLDKGFDPEWFHIGSLSSTGNLAVEPVRDVPVPSVYDKGQWGHRLYWMWRYGETVADSWPERADLYRANVQTLRDDLQLSDDDVMQWHDTVNELITWDERRA